jgi:hypothetical protein
MSLVVAARLLPAEPLGKARPRRDVRDGTGDQGCCGVEVRGFEPLASSGARDNQGDRMTWANARKRLLTCAVG